MPFETVDDLKDLAAYKKTLKTTLAALKKPTPFRFCEKFPIEPGKKIALLLLGKSPQKDLIKKFDDAGEGKTATGKCYISKESPGKLFFQVKKGSLLLDKLDATLSKCGVNVQVALAGENDVIPDDDDESSSPSAKSSEEESGEREHEQEPTSSQSVTEEASAKPAAKIDVNSWISARTGVVKGIESLRDSVAEFGATHPKSARIIAELNEVIGGLNVDLDVTLRRLNAANDGAQRKALKDQVSAQVKQIIRLLGANAAVKKAENAPAEIGVKVEIVKPIQAALTRIVTSMSK
jgi:hypothetical protein